MDQVSDLSSMAWAYPILSTENFTRFYILSQGLDVALPANCALLTQNMAVLRLQMPPDDLVKQTTLNIPRVIGALDLEVPRIDRRPSLHARPFDDVYFLEVGVTAEQKSCGQLWKKQLQQAVDKVRGMGVEVSVLGCW